MPELPNLSKRVSEISAREAITISSSSSMKDAAKSMNEKELDAVFIRLEDRLSIITKNDFVRLAENNISPEIPVEKISSKKPLVTSCPGDSVVDAIIKMKQNQVKHIPILSEDGEVSSYITQDDVKEHHDFIFSNMCNYKVIENEGKEVEEPMPTGTVAKKDDCKCALIIFEADDTIGRIIDLVTGGYGYSHVAIDCCEIEEETGKPLMIEATGSGGVERSYQDRYGDRGSKRVELPIENCKEFCEKVKSKIGQPYDFLEAISLGLLGDDDKQICSGLPKNALKESGGAAIIDEILRRTLRRGSIVDHGKPCKVFISPNGWAEFFGLPRVSSTNLGIFDFGDIIDKIRNSACFSIKTRAENIKITNITQTPIAPSPSIGCVTLTDGMITSNATDEIESQVNKVWLENKCNDGCACISTLEKDLLTFHYSQKKTTNVNRTFPWRPIPDIHCKVTLQVDFDIILSVKLGMCV